VREWKSGVGLLLCLVLADTICLMCDTTRLPANPAADSTSLQQQSAAGLMTAPLDNAC
jgi:hypothetical protein